jgi:hypothetical protein
VNQILEGDCLERLAELEDNSIDLILTDPPYGLNKFGSDKLNKRIVDIGFPDLNQLDSEFFQEFLLSGIPLDSSLLRRLQILMVIKSRIGMPEGSVDFDGDVVGGEEEVQDGHEPSSRISDSVLWEEGDFEGLECVGDFTLDFRYSSKQSGFYSSGSDDAQFLSGSLAVPCIPVFLRVATAFSADFLRRARASGERSTK